MCIVQFLTHAAAGLTDRSSFAGGWWARLAVQGLLSLDDLMLL